MKRVVPEINNPVFDFSRLCYKNVHAMVYWRDKKELRLQMEDELKSVYVFMGVPPSINRDWDESRIARELEDGGYEFRVEKWVGVGSTRKTLLE